jgi:predicted  nucleic acid-binding Zn-ribbon protein
MRDMIVDPYEIEDTSDWLGSPTELETCKQYMLILENEVQELTLQLRKAREDVFGLVQMNSQLSDERSRLKIELRNAEVDIARLHSETSELGGQVKSLQLVVDHRVRILKELKQTS